MTFTDGMRQRRFQCTYAHYYKHLDYVAENMVMNIFNTFKVVCKSSKGYLLHTSCQFKGALLWFRINLSHIVEGKKKNTDRLYIERH